MLSRVLWSLVVLLKKEVEDITENICLISNIFLINSSKSFDGEVELWNLYRLTSSNRFDCSTSVLPSLHARKLKDLENILSAVPG